MLFQRLTRRVSVLAVTAAALLASPALRAEIAYAVDSNTILVSFDTDRPERILTMGLIRGLQPGEGILGVDFRPRDSRLYGLGSSGRIYTIGLQSAIATQVGTGAFPTPLDGKSFGVDFNPTVDRIRIVSDKGQNLRAHPDTGALVATDRPLNYSDNTVPNAVASAYTNSFFGSTSTTLYNLDSKRGALVTQIPPNDGRLNVVAPLTGIDLSDVAGFDISPNTNIGYFVVRNSNAQTCEVYMIDVRTGATMRMGRVGALEQLGSFAIAPLAALPQE